VDRQLLIFTVISGAAGLASLVIAIYMFIRPQPAGWKAWGSVIIFVVLSVLSYIPLKHLLSGDPALDSIDLKLNRLSERIASLTAMIGKQGSDQTVFRSPAAADEFIKRLNGAKKLDEVGLDELKAAFAAPERSEELLNLGSQIMLTSRSGMKRSQVYLCSSSRLPSVGPYPELADTVNRPLGTYPIQELLLCGQAPVPQSRSCPAIQLALGKLCSVLDRPLPSRLFFHGFPPPTRPELNLFRDYFEAADEAIEAVTTSLMDAIAGK
jgi:hypothetical protein